ncbi:G8 domain-containing protein [Microbulbifer sp. YPW1]|uniref:G8 domain-containing protein n=1 Tax=Microbulbifer sp. YPW1 TaxID=2745199 RepID=UPI00159A5FE6|nr:G8 domain-containing protein [Microbulbifer sp. YPW1]QKX16583.1 cadherin-like domain-containing protein [Microbulbifer sp. YPW1]
MFHKLFTVSIFFLFLTGCGGGGGSSDTTEANPDPDPDPPVPTEPQPEADPWEVNCFTQPLESSNNTQLPTLTEGPMPNHSGSMLTEHMAALDLVDYQQATHVAVANGDWCDATVWHNGDVPGTDARVVIPEGFKITYASVSDADLKTLRVDGELSFATDKPSYLLVDTIFIDPRGRLEIGTPEKPVAANARVAIVFSDRGAIDTSWDPLVLSRGLIAHGQTTIHGERKTTHLKVKEDPAKGDDTIVLAETPRNWHTGDQVVIAGTYYSGWKWDNDAQEERYFGTQDEVRTIANINGNVVTLSEPLKYDHFTPRADLHTSVANFSRNITFQTENADDLPVFRRGHVMFMHSDKVDVRYAEFRQLGRTDKSVPSSEVDQLDIVRADSNVRGRYPFHFHRTGLDDPKNPAIAVGNAIFGSPGWGLVHHDSHANFYENASFDTHGAGFVAESGNETGDWVRNIAIKAQGTKNFNPKNGMDRETYDIARTGEGFWFQSRMVRSFANIAASVNHGFVYLHRGTGMINFPAQQYMLPEALGYGTLVAPDDVPIRAFDDNEAFGCQVGLYIVKANPMQQHDIYTVLSDFTAWEVEAGAAAEYTSHYLFKNFDVIGNTPEEYRDPVFGIEMGNNSSDMVVRDSRIKGFPEGIRLSKFHTEDRWKGKDQFVLIDNHIEGAATEFVELDTDADTFVNGADLVTSRFEIHLNDDLPIEYLDPSTADGAGISYYGRKVDSIGENPLPGGGDELLTVAADMIGQLKHEGYRETSSGDAYTVIEQYFSDRATGRIHKVGLKTRLGDNVIAAINKNDSPWSVARFDGSIDLESRPPSVVDDEAHTAFEQSVVVDVLKNDSDPDGDSISIDGIVQPRNGVAFKNTDGTFEYRPNIGFSGVDIVQFWVSDSNGNFVESNLTVNVATP